MTASLGVVLREIVTSIDITWYRNKITIIILSKLNIENKIYMSVSEKNDTLQ
jgi:hypothetical protein